ncbi:MAG: SlyX family protein [Xanthomonadales bacterium]|nr:SlyX family protein [Xanthomonadales bacterium]
MSADKRIETLESQAAFQDELLVQLNEVIARQDRDISRLQARVEALFKRLEEVQASIPAAGSDPADEVPPHY